MVVNYIESASWAEGSYALLVLFAAQRSVIYHVHKAAQAAKGKGLLILGGKSSTSKIGISSQSNNL